MRPARRRGGTAARHALVLSAALAGACAAPRDHFYTLQALGPGAAERAGARTGVTLHVHLPPALDRAPLVVHVSAEEVLVLEHERWLGLPSEQIESALARDLEARRPGLWVNGRVGGEGAWDIEIDVARMSVDADHQARLEARWRIILPGEPDRLGEAALSEPVSSAGGYPAIALAFSRDVGALADRLAASLPHPPDNPHGGR